MIVNKAPSLFKVVVAGPTGVGKTCLVRRFADGKMPESTKTTIGVAFSLKRIQITNDGNGSNETVTFQLWDFAGQSQFKAVLPAYMKSARGVILSFDLSNLESFNLLPDWVAFLQKYLRAEPVKVPILLVGTKSDLKAQVSIDMIDDFAKRHGLSGWCLVSSLNGENVESTFGLLAREMLSVRYRN